MRTIVEIPDEIIKSLDRITTSEKRSRASLIREAIGEYLKQRALPPAEAAFGLWKPSKEDGIAYQTRLRGEWDRK